MKRTLLDEKTKEVTGRTRQLKSLQTVSLCLLILMLFPVVGFAFAEGSDRAVKYENYTQVASVDNLDACVRLSLERPLAIIKCGANSETPSFFRSSSAQHFYWRGEIVDNELDQVAEQITKQIYLSNQSEQVEQAKSQKKDALIILWIGILILMGIVGFICSAFGNVVVFSSILDLVINIGFLILGGIIAAVWGFCSENGHLYGINFSSHDFQVFLLIWLSLWFIWNAIQAFRHNNPFLALLALASRITTPVFIILIWSWITSAIDRFSSHGCKR